MGAERYGHHLAQIKPAGICSGIQIQAKRKIAEVGDMVGSKPSREVESATKSVTGGGRPLDAGLQQSMGANFRGVKVYQDTLADQLNQSIQAKVLTPGQDVFIPQGVLYQPGSLGSPGLASTPGLAAVVQAAWKPVLDGSHPPNYYWAGRNNPIGEPPNNGNIVAPPPLESLVDTHSGRTGSMKSLRTRPDYPEANLSLLSHYGAQARDKKGIFYEGETEERGLGLRQVEQTIPDRDKHEHRRLFGEMTGGQTSATKYMQQNELGVPDTKYEILHAMGHGQGGRQTQDSKNLAAASQGANTQMIPFDNAISGNPNIMVDTSFTIMKGTERAERINQTFFHKEHLDEPIHKMVIDGDYPVPTVGQYELLEEEANRLKDPEVLDAAARLMNINKRKQYPDAAPTLMNTKKKKQYP
ncbi:MAG: DUF4157 domain-containing protein [Heteroscytonema crispum UTEX LB 1556]